MDKNDVKHLKVHCGDFAVEMGYVSEINGNEYDDLSDLLNEYPDLMGDDEYDLMLVIDVTNGKVINWPKGNQQDFYDYKICDGGKYVMLDKDNNIINEYEGYVPPCLTRDDGYGDYFEFEIDESSFIPDWEFTDEDFETLMEENDDY